MGSLSVGTTFTLDAPVDTVGFLRLRPSDHAPSSKQFTASHSGAVIPTTSLHDVGAHCGSRIGVGQVVRLENFAVHASELAAPMTVRVGS